MSALGKNPKLFEVFRREFDTLSARLEAQALALAERPEPGVVDQALRALHSLKGNCHLLGFEGMAALTHAAETALEPLRAGAMQDAGDVAEALLEVNDQLRVMTLEPTRPAPDALLARLAAWSGAVAAPPVVSAEAPPETSAEAVALPVADLRGLFELSESARAALLAGDVRATGPRLAELSRRLLQARQSTVATLVPTLRRLVRETARERGKLVSLSVGGESLQAEIPILEDLARVLPHLLRNAIDHGIEPPDERRAAHKPERSRLQLLFTQEGGELVAAVIDDGRGIDEAVIARRAVERGLLSATEADRLTHDERLRLILLPGFTTRQSADRVSGRGIGLDVVDSTVRKRGGRLEIDSRPGDHTRFELRFPVAFRWEEYLAVRLGQRLIGLPVRAVAEILVREDSPPPRGGLLELRQEAIPVIGFANLDAGFGAEQRRPMVILDLGGTRLALAVDELVTFAGTLVEALPGPGHLYFAGLGRTPTGDLLYCLDVGQIARNWNALMVPEEP